MDSTSKRPAAFSTPRTSVSKGKNISFNSYTPIPETADDYDYPVTEFISPPGRRVKTLLFQPFTKVWPFFGEPEDSATFALEVRAQSEYVVQPFQHAWIDTGVRFQKEHLSPGFTVMFKGWKLTEKVLTRDKIIDLTIRQKPNSNSDLFMEYDEFQIKLLNLSTSPFVVPNGTPLGRIVLSFNEY